MENGNEALFPTIQGVAVTACGMAVEFGPGRNPAWGSHAGPDRYHAVSTDWTEEETRLASRGIAFVEDAPSIRDRVAAVLSSERPAFLGRIGGSDTDVVLSYAALRDGGGAEAAWDYLRGKAALVKRYNGFYDRDGGREQLEAYAETVIAAQVGSAQAFLVGPYLLSRFFPQTINPQFKEDYGPFDAAHRFLIDRLDRAHAACSLYPYTFVENIDPRGDDLFALFSKVLAGKRVLIVSPFTDSFKTNFPRRDAVLKGYRFPDFAPLYCTTPITYDGLPSHLYPHRNWSETLDALKSEISGYDFDVALLSCGSYASPLGVHIAETMGRKAVYVGGVLQLLFGVIGRRYRNPYFLQHLNADALIEPVERAKYLPYAHIDEGTAAEGFAAYF